MDNGVVILAIPIPSTSPVYPGVVAAHVVVDLACVIAGLVAMLSAKRPGRHPVGGTTYYYSLARDFASMTELSVVRCPEDAPLFFLGVLSLTAANAGRAARSLRGTAGSSTTSGMGPSYILLLTAATPSEGAPSTALASFENPYPVR